MEQHGSNRNKMVRHVAMAGVLALAGAGFASTAWAGMMPEGYVKCYGIAKAHQNQCMSIGGITRGSAATNGNPDAWLAVPKGVCQKIVGGSLTPGK
ncbi:DUF2282 domain-containing protein [Acidithiobacillus sp. CV18-2]|uniref:DUF2282 domain-containing protein n=1 Tax=Igneacidithiobacillus copahuensis TaxID=2724909 RepID=A0AAE3CJT2_9PROT|nr:DUF2282 domain-containing protein [Igneacidithiobacillus copahuensis]MBU2753566.1 DUF2282 domain-containing protein [Acidithiobacillus sp. CV18-3]MBU2757361.1 DUF2282 domain-containing protein [Acidithiobacillus sp. BN09-2]MBU2776060.1 DUF2282 domain-containing protein [Acidithiobacillus sp. CV18-2]MBU2795351.1 DUF2282 domain-containing protein [Acidithiobacillus sp. VAN18-2]MBU2800263.1 DUF2282 domain-containing protein [Acidithiobacillus sp. VAN18-4]UTV79791.1 DUF2282 domain-containing p